MLGLLTLGLGSCADDLNISSIDPQSSPSYDANSLLAKQYATLGLTGQKGPAGSGDLSMDEGESGFYRVVFNLEELPTDECIWAWQTDPDIPALTNIAWNSNSVRCNWAYQRLSYDITLYNQFITEQSGKLSDDVIAEVRFLRALNLYYFLDLFHKAPFKDTYDNNLPVEKSGKDLYNWLDNELTEIEPLLKDVGATTTTHTELASKYTTAKMDVNASEMNNALVELWQSAHPDESVPASIPVYVRLRACIDGTSNPYLGQTYSNTITLPSVKATYVAPDATYPDNLFVVGSSIQTAWTSWKVVPPVYGLSGNYYTMIYVPAGGSFKWGTYNNDWRGYSRLTAINDKANAGISESTDGNSNIIVANGGWYVLLFVGDITSDGKNINYSLNVYPGTAYVIGAAAGGDWTDGNVVWAMKAPADASGSWESPAFTAGGELRAYIKVPGLDWYRTEFTIYKGSLYFNNPLNNWSTDFGSDYSVSCAAGQKLYVNFDANTGEVK